MGKVNDEEMNNEHHQKEKREVEETEETQNRGGGHHNECFFFFLIDVSPAKIYHGGYSLGRFSVSGGRDEWMPTGNHLNMYSEACVLRIWMGCQQQR